MLVTPPTLQTDVTRWEAQGAVRLPLSTRTGEIFGTLWVREDGQALVVLNRPAPAGQVYQAWGRQAGDTQAAVPVSLGITGNTVMQVRWQGYGSVGISIEPAGEAGPHPTAWPGQSAGRVAGWRYTASG
ncbi:hypothetical protein ACFSC4_06790 [Deinococcus malanensis]|uniref:hypothetical protein n=1 Tax=Deinococcus malanensis TaxID=1706855 RepID=UPI0036373801